VFSVEILGCAGSDLKPAATTGSAPSSPASNPRPSRRAPADDSAATAGPGYSVAAAGMAAVEQWGPPREQLPRPAPRLEPEPTYSDMEAPSKGLRNSRGENNCFLNSAVQVCAHVKLSFYSCDWPTRRQRESTR